MVELVKEFQGEHRFLSNFWRSKMVIDNIEYPSNEHWYVYNKCARSIASFRNEVLEAERPGDVKKLGKSKRCTTPPEWDNDDHRIAIMDRGVRAKFTQNPELKRKLIATGDAVLQEGNRWGDTFWGVELRVGKEKGKGRNELGKILMDVRKELREKEESLI